MDRYIAYAPCSHCFESSGYAARVHPATWDEPSWADADLMAPCPYCDHTGMVEADEPRTLDDLENEEWSADLTSWFDSICALVKGETPISMEHAA